MIKEVPIVMIFDENFVIPALSTVFSIIKNGNKETFFKFIFLSDSVKEYDKFNILKNKLKNFDITYILIEKELTDMLGEPKNRIYYLRLLIPKLLKEYDKVIYIDSDTVVISDLSEFYNIELQNNLIAGVLDLDQESRINNLYINAGVKISQYINAGIILLSPKRIFNEGYFEKMIEAIKYKFGFLDQDVLNLVLSERIKLADGKFNFFSSCDGDIKSVCILHYAGNKPWIRYYSYRPQEFFKILHELFELGIVSKKEFINFSNRQIRLKHPDKFLQIKFLNFVTECLNLIGIRDIRRVVKSILRINARHK